MRKSIIYAHRGFSGLYPENTMAAFIAAENAGAGGFELDVHLTKDREIVVIHDSELSRTTNGSGYIKNFTLKNIRKLNAGSWLGPEFKNERVPLLRDVLDRFAGKKKIIIEIKADREGLPGIEEKLVSLLSGYSLRDSVTISSFLWDPLVKTNRLNPELKLAKTFSPKDIGRTLFSRKALADFEDKINIIQELHPHYPFVNKKFMKIAEEKGLTTVPWTVNSHRSINRLMDLCVHGIITNYPNRGVQVLKLS